MPIYEYACGKCEKTFEVWQKINDAPPAKCELCGSKKVARVISQTSFQLKGDGWYASGYSKASDKGGKAKADAPSEKPTEKKNDAKKPAKDSASSKAAAE